MEKYYLDETKYTEGIPSISTFNNDNAQLPSVIDRYYTRYYYMKSENGENEDHLILFHTNGVCLVGLAKSHIVFEKGIESINYNIGNCDRSQQLAKGKHKKGAMNLQRDTCLAVITTKDGFEYKVMSCIYGKLLEVNSRLKENLKMLEIEGHGYIAVILPKSTNTVKEKESLVTHNEYTSSKNQ